MSGVDFVKPVLEPKDFMFKVASDANFRQSFLTDPDALLLEYDVPDELRNTIKRMDLDSLRDSLSSVVDFETPQDGLFATAQTHVQDDHKDTHSNTGSDNSHTDSHNRDL